MSGEAAGEQSRFDLGRQTTADPGGTPGRRDGAGCGWREKICDRAYAIRIQEREEPTRRARQA